MKTFNPITPSNRHCILTSNNNLLDENIKKLKDKYTLYHPLKHLFIQGVIIQKKNNIIEIDAGLQSNIELSEKELSNIRNINKLSYNIGNRISLFIYRKEYLVGDQLINHSLLYNKLQINKNKFYYQYKLFKILINKKINNKSIKAIIFGIDGFIFNYINIGVGGFRFAISKHHFINYNDINYNNQLQNPIAYHYLNIFMLKVSLKNTLRNKKTVMFNKNIRNNILKKKKDKTIIKSRRDLSFDEIVDALFK